MSWGKKTDRRFAARGGGGVFRSDRDDVFPILHATGRELLSSNGLDVVGSFPIIARQSSPFGYGLPQRRAADDPPGKSGIAHFLEHLMLGWGTKRHPWRIPEFASEVGGMENA